MTKTNAMRLLDAAGIAYRTAEYEYDESDLSGKHAAEQLGMPAEQVFKTLVTRGDKTGLLVFCIPVLDELDLRRPIYRKTAAYGHFGRELPEFTWERTDKADDLRKACGLA